VWIDCVLCNVCDTGEIRDKFQSSVERCLLCYGAYRGGGSIPSKVFLVLYRIVSYIVFKVIEEAAT
jgi:hypothetical protein